MAVPLRKAGSGPTAHRERPLEERDAPLHEQWVCRCGGRGKISHHAWSVEGGPERRRADLRVSAVPARHSPKGRDGSSATTREKIGREQGRARVCRKV